MPRHTTKPLSHGHKRGQPFVVLIGTLVALMLASLPMTAPAVYGWQRGRMLDSQSYKQTYGQWEVLDIPEAFRNNTIHAAALPTGKVLLVAGSGNNRDNFNAYHDEGKMAVLATAIYDPASGQIKNIPTPSDLFCAGHALLQSGSLLVAGGTSGYELLDGDATKPAGAMMVHNENPDDKPRTLKKGTVFVSPSGREYRSTQEVVLPPVTKMDHGNGEVMIHHSSTKVFVEATAKDKAYITSANEQYRLKGLSGKDAQNIYGQGGPMTLNKQDYRGDNLAYEFDPVKEQYVRVGDMKESRWYPSLPMLTNGDVLAVSGLDNTGIITETTERYDPASKSWEWGPNQPFPTYPALFRTMDPEILFYSGSNAGYGPVDKGRQPGFWDVATDSFRPVEGLRQQDILETSASLLLPPDKGSNDGSQSQRIMVAGGGGVGESPLVTARTDIIDLALSAPRFTPGPDLPQAVHYLNMTVTPWDEIFANGGSTDYRAKGNSYSMKSFSLNPSDDTITPMADELVGRTYHSGSLLLRDGRIMVFGGDPLYSDKDNTAPGTFEQRVEIFTPPQYFKGTAPVLNGPGELQAKRSQSLSFSSKQAADIRTARLIPPSSTTHATNVEQRSVAAVVSKSGDTLKVKLPDDENLLPNGWYMLFLVDGNDRPAQAKMVHITG